MGLPREKLDQNATPGGTLKLRTLKKKDKKRNYNPGTVTTKVTVPREKTRPQNPFGAVILGATQMDSKKTEKAKQSLQHLRKGDPSHVGLHIKKL